jgi:hypothetical protein
MISICEKTFITSLSSYGKHRAAVSYYQVLAHETKTSWLSKFNLVLSGSWAGAKRLIKSFTPQRLASR